jgi:hypothetical protein
VYGEFNDQHFTEKLAEEEGIEVSRETVRKIRRAAGMGPKRKRRGKKHRKRRERKAQEGWMVLWDGSPHPWFGPNLPPCCFMAAIDDATGLTEITQMTVDDITTLYGNFGRDTLIAFENWGAGTQGLLKGVGDAFGNLGQSAIKMVEDVMGSMMEMSIQKFLTDKEGAIGGVIKSVMDMPFPLNLMLVGGAIAAVELLFSKIKHFDEGGFVQAPMLGMLHPNEAVIPLNKMHDVINNYNYHNQYGAGRGSQQPQYINLSLSFDGQVFDKRIIKVTGRALQLGNLKVPGRSIG